MTRGSRRRIRGGWFGIRTGSVARLFPLALAGGFGLGLPASAQEPPAPEGLWITEEETAVIEVRKCDAGLCGRIVWMERGVPRLDEENPEEELRGRPLCGLEILRGFERNPDRPEEWRGGEVYAPDDGRTYSGRVRVEGPDELDLRGYVGIRLFGRSQTWVRVSEEDHPRCEPPS